MLVWPFQFCFGPEKEDKTTFFEIFAEIPIEFASPANLFFALGVSLGRRDYYSATIPIIDSFIHCFNSSTQSINSSADQPPCARPVASFIQAAEVCDFRPPVAREISSARRRADPRATSLTHRHAPPRQVSRGRLCTCGRGVAPSNALLLLTRTARSTVMTVTVVR